MIGPSQRSNSSARASAIDATSLYTLPEFRRVSGLGRESIRNAKRKGVELTTLRVGRRKYVRGTDGIAFIEQLAAL